MCGRKRCRLSLTPGDKPIHLETLFDSGQPPRVDGTYILRYHVADRAAVDRRLRAEIAWVAWPPWGDRHPSCSMTSIRRTPT
jgi:hypothetical protein